MADFVRREYGEAKLQEAQRVLAGMSRAAAE